MSLESIKLQCIELKNHVDGLLCQVEEIEKKNTKKHATDARKTLMKCKNVCDNLRKDILTHSKNKNVKKVEFVEKVDDVEKVEKVENVEPNTTTEKKKRGRKKKE
jgi:hypothetical protein